MSSVVPNEKQNQVNEQPVLHQFTRKAPAISVWRFDAGTETG